MTDLSKWSAWYLAGVWSISSLSGNLHDKGQREAPTETWEKIKAKTKAVSWLSRPRPSNDCFIYLNCQSDVCGIRVWRLAILLPQEAR